MDLNCELLRPKTEHYMSVDGCLHVVTRAQASNLGPPVSADDWIEYVPLRAGLGRCVHCGHHSMVHYEKDLRCLGFTNDMEHPCDCSRFIAPEPI